MKVEVLSSVEDGRDIELYDPNINNEQIEIQVFVLIVLFVLFVLIILFVLIVLFVLIILFGLITLCVLIIL